MHAQPNAQEIGEGSLLHDLDATENHEFFKKTLFIAVLGVASFAAFLFGFMHYAGINELSDFHANLNFAYAALSFLMILDFRVRTDHLKLKVVVFLVASQLTFTSAFVDATDDQYRAVWFYLLAAVAYILGDKRAGLAVVIASLAIMLGVKQFLGININSATYVSMTAGIIILAFIMQAYTGRVRDYVQLIHEKNQQLLDLAKLDPLTGVLNSRYFHEFGQRLMNIAKRNREALSILYIDLDYFKNVNDQFGHHAGDKLLIAVADVIQKSLRQSDIFARIGGEEFCILLPKTDTAGALKLAEKIRAQIELFEVEHENQSLSVTASIGVVSRESDSELLRDLLVKADKFLYVAKSQGRNQVVHSN